MHDDLKQEAFEANLLLPEYKLIDLTFGNVSVIDRDAGVIAIKPSGVPYAEMQAEDMVLLDLDGRKVGGALKPSSDAATHVRLYQAFEEIGGVVHTHSRFATSFAQAGVEIPCYGTTHADYFHGAIALTRSMTPDEIAGEYELETGNVIVERFKDLSYLEHPGVLVKSHGPFSWGADGRKAVEHAFTMELLAQMAFTTRQLNPDVEPIPRELLDKHFLRKHGSSAYYGQG